MAAKRAGKPATYDDLLKLPENVIGELMGGELIVSPRPAGPHTLAGSTIGGDLNSSFSRPPGGPHGPGGWWILFEPELHFHGDILVPDLAGWRRERMPRVPEGHAFELAPDWVCEIISPSSVRRDRGRKLDIYSRELVPWVWLVDPAARTLEVFRRDDDAAWKLVQSFGEEPVNAVRAQPFDAIELDLTRWFPEP